RQIRRESLSLLYISSRRQHTQMTSVGVTTRLLRMMAVAPTIPGSPRSTPMATGQRILGKSISSHEPPDRIRGLADSPNADLRCKPCSVQPWLLIPQAGI